MCPRITVETNVEESPIIPTSSVGFQNPKIYSTMAYAIQIIYQWGSKIQSSPNATFWPS